MADRPAPRILSTVTLLVWFVSGICYGHGAVDSMDNHEYQDRYIFEQTIKAEKNKPLYEKLTDFLSQWDGSVLTRFISNAFAIGNNPGIDGEWEPVTTWPLVFASAANLPDGRIIAWGASAVNHFGGVKGYTYASIWDPATGQFTTANNTTHSMFCGVPVMLEDGRVFVAGGDLASPASVKATSTFNYLTNSWTQIQNMNVGRWYNGSVALPNGKVFTAVGDPGSPYPEIWNQGSGWSYLNGASLQKGILDFPTKTEPKNMLPHLHLAPNGQIFHSGHTPEMHFIDTENNGAVLPVSIRNDWNLANTPGIMFDEGKLLQAGGKVGTAGTKKAAVIDLNSNIPSRTLVADMHFARIFHNEVVLPNGEVMVIGGNTSGAKFTDTNTQMTPEIWNPTTGVWRTVAPHDVPRNYHSVALLMTDGRVWSGGGGLPGSVTNPAQVASSHPDSQVYSPAYLFNPDGSLAARPDIFNAPSLVSYGRVIEVAASSSVTKFSMIKMSSTTHALNTDMQFLNVPFIENNQGTYSLTLHTNPNVMTPGYWMLFALNAQGVPSVAKVIKVTTSNVPVLTNPGTQYSTVNTGASLNMLAVDPDNNPLTFSAVGLPAGMDINQVSGQITGIPTTTGNNLVVVSATDGTNTIATNFVWNIVDKRTTVATGVSGNSGAGDIFRDNVGTDQVLTSININTSSVIDSVQAVLNTGELIQHGGNTGTAQNVTWPADEYLVRIYGLYGSSISQISFVTNTGRVMGPYGTASGGLDTNLFDITVPAGREIVGFTGRADVSLNAIGAMHRAWQQPNQPPIVTTITEQTGTIGVNSSLEIVATDPEGASLSYSAIGLPAGLTINASTGLIDGTPTSVGSYDVIVNVSDPKGGASALNFIWTINPSSVQINPVIAQPKEVAKPITYLGSTKDGASPMFKWSFGDGTAETAYSSSGSVTHTFKMAGIYLVKLTVVDNGATNSITFKQAVYGKKTLKEPALSSNMAITVGSGNNRLWVVNQDNDSVSVFNTDTNSKVAEIPVGKSPRAIAVAPSGQLWVTNKADATISMINPVSLTVQQTLSLPYASQPFGITFAPSGASAYVALEATGKLLKLNSTTGDLLTSLDVGANPRHLAVTNNDATVLVSRFITPPLPGESTKTVLTTVNTVKFGGEVVVVGASTMAIQKTIVLQHNEILDSEINGYGIPNYLAMVAISPDGKNAWVPSKKDNVKRGVYRKNITSNLTFENTVRGISSKINMTTLAEVYANRIDFNNSGMASAARFDKSGNYLFVALENTREVAVVDAYASRELFRVDVGRAPDGLTVSADGKKLYVNNFMDRSVSVVDLTDMLNGVDTIPPVIAQMASVSNEKLSPTVLNGKQLFYDAKDTRLARDGYLSCAACHNDGGHDGRVWDLTGFGEGLRNTVDLRGHGGMAQGRLHWTGNFDEVQDFEGQIRSLAAGTGLMTDTDFSNTQNSLGAAKAGKSADLDALAAYVDSLKTFAPSPLRDSNGNLTEPALLGKTLFTSAGCNGCHSGTPFTDSPTGQLHNVGTIKTSSGKRLGSALTGFDTPTLKDVWNTAPYLHDGSAATVSASIKAHSNIVLTTTEIDQIAAYIQQLGETN